MDKGVTRILWSGLTKPLGLQAIKAAQGRDDIEIAYGVSDTRMDAVSPIGRVTNDGMMMSGTYHTKKTALEVATGTSLEGIEWAEYQDLTFPYDRFQDVDVVVDFSSPDKLGPVLTAAIMLNKPLVIGTSGFSEFQDKELSFYAPKIPIFREVDCRFEVKDTVDPTVESEGQDSELDHLAQTVLEIAKVMAQKREPAKDGFYTLDNIREEISEAAKV